MADKENLFNGAPVPDLEFIGFAVDFARNFQKIHPKDERGAINLASSKGTYRIEYVYEIKGPDGKPLTTDIRVTTKPENFIIQASKLRLFGSDVYNEDYVFFLMIWCWFKREVFHNRTDTPCDLHTTEYVLKKFPDVKPMTIIKGFSHTCNLSLNHHNLERISHLADKLKV